VAKPRAGSARSAARTPTSIAFFATPARFRRWLEKHHATASMLWVGYYKKDSGKPSITWPESVDEALCFGWIDGLRKSIDACSYTLRFTPRKPRSVWSEINVRRAEALIAARRMRPAGLAAFEARRPNRSGIYSYEQRGEQLPEPYASALRKNRTAWRFFQAQTPSYRKACGWWVVSAKKEETRRARLAKLVDLSARGRPIPQFTRRAGAK
jgi:uncharacterized protein YdeI (YjbR/CyaY-like superfamily)